MIIEVNGTRYTNFLRAEAGVQFDAFSRYFSFTAVADKSEAIPFSVGDSCKVFADGIKVLTGAIESLVVDYNAEQHTVTVAGRDKTADLLDSTLGPIDNISGEELTLKALIDIVVKHLGLGLKVVDKVQPAVFTADEDLPSPEIGQNAFEFIESYARKRQALLVSDADGNIVITRNTGEQAVGAVQHIIGAEDNNVLSATFEQNTSERFRLYKVSSGLNFAALPEGDVDSAVNQSGDVQDNQIRVGRQMVLVSENPFSSANCKDRAVWEADVRKARSTVYDATVVDYRVGGDSGDLWQVGKVYTIKDDFIGLARPMLCDAVRFTFGEEGRKTELGFIGKDAYKAEPPEKSESVNANAVLLDDI